ncbi:hypothetical protein ACFLZH_03290 [Patescibacteria group bacterium]
MPKIVPPGQGGEIPGQIPGPVDPTRVEICFKAAGMVHCIVVPGHVKDKIGVGGIITKDGVEGVVESITDVPTDTPLDGDIVE